METQLDPGVVGRAQDEWDDQASKGGRKWAEADVESDVTQRRVNTALHHCHGTSGGSHLERRLV